MNVWLNTVFSAMGRWRRERRINRESLRIAREIYAPLWEDVRRKVASNNENDLIAYAKVRAAQLSQERVDSLMQTNPGFSGAFATRLLVKSTDRATDLVLSAAARARHTAA
jgi:hypothetical protein